MTRPLLLAGIGLLKVARRFGWEAVADESLDRLHPPVIFAANHESHADTAAILGTLPIRLRRHTAVAAAMDVFGAGRTARFRARFLEHIVAAGFHAFAFDRHGPPMRSLRTAMSLIRRNWNILLYPEGTRSRSGDLGPFKLGVGVLARRTGSPVVPIFVTGGRDVLPCGSFLPRRGRMIVRYGSALTFDPSESVEAFTERLHARVSALGGGVRGMQATTTHGGATDVEVEPDLTEDGGSLGWPRHLR